MLDHCPDKKFEGEIWGKIMKAIRDFKMIEEGDKVCVAVSGGKDSLTLLRMLHLFQKREAIKFDLVAVHVITDISLGSGDYEPAIVKNVFKEWGIEYATPAVALENPQYNKKGFVDCYWCSSQKRRLLFAEAEKFGCNKIAFGHHKDDVAITNLMNALYLGNLQTMRVNHEFFGGKYNIIRPLCYLREREIIKYSKMMELPATCSCCRVAKDGRREQTGEILEQLEQQIPDVVESLFQAFVKNNETLVKLGYKDKAELRQQNMGCGTTE